MSDSEAKRRLPKKTSVCLLLTAMCLCLMAGCAHPVPTPQPSASTPAQTPVPEQDSACDVLFYGDSLTAGGNFGDFFPDLQVVNLGINGATLEDLTEWVPRVSAHHPDKVFVMAGGNNLDAGNAEECTELYRGLLDALREACPDAEIFVESMLPLDKAIASKANCPNRVIRAFNGRV
jgi:lysophospholipase L1-like esterase